MRIVELLNQIRPVWIERVSRKLARGESVRESFVDQLSEFLDLLQQSVMTGDPSWINKILDDWTDARTQSELEQREASLSPLLQQIFFLFVYLLQF